MLVSQRLFTLRIFHAVLEGRIAQLGPLAYDFVVLLPQVRCCFFFALEGTLHSKRLTPEISRGNVCVFHAPLKFSRHKLTSYISSKLLGVLIFYHKFYIMSNYKYFSSSLILSLNSAAFSNSKF